jgi:hypothetical protein
MQVQGRSEMKRSMILTASILTCLLTATLSTATTAHALVISYGQSEIAKAGVGCVGGWVSGHGNTAFFRGNTAMINEQLALLAKDEPRSRSVTVVLHAGVSFVDDPEEMPLTHADQARSQISVDWSVNRFCPFAKVRTGFCKCDERNVTVHIWVANEIRLDELRVPVEFAVRSSGEIDEFVERHVERK